MKETKHQSVLVINIGSSTVKWAVYESLFTEKELQSGNEPFVSLETVLPRIIGQTRPHSCVVRFVHGGTAFAEPTLITSKELKELEALIELAPLHNRAAFDCIRALHHMKEVSAVIAVFDTELFVNLPDVAKVYGLPWELTERYAIRRFGFHGFAHASMLRSCNELTNGDQHSHDTSRRVVTIQLGSGCSMAAFLDDEPVDTSMGFSPNEGLLMSTRCGDIDAGLITWLQKKEGWDPQQTDAVLNQHSGWQGISGISSDLREVMKSGTERADIALELFAHRIRKTLGAYYALLGSLDAIVLSGGISEHAPSLCRWLLARLQHLGIDVASDGSTTINDDSSHIELSTCDSRVRCLIVPLDEARAMFRAASRSEAIRQLLQHSTAQP